VAAVIVRGLLALAGRLLPAVFSVVFPAVVLAAGNDVATAYGKPDRDVPGWVIRTHVPEGWTQDCCTYAQAIGVNLVLYKGEWTGEPERVMVLNVWPAKLATLEAELQDDRKHYLQRDPAGKVSVLTLEHTAMPCAGVLYEGSDHKDDAVVFCDPGQASGIRLSWSMALAHGDTERQSLLELFRRVAQQSSYAKYTPAAAHH
jgi:hypothetical protein